MAHRAAGHWVPLLGSKVEDVPADEHQPREHADRGSQEVPRIVVLFAMAVALVDGLVVVIGVRG